jgi:hypothetical protein
LSELSLRELWFESEARLSFLSDTHGILRDKVSDAFLVLYTTTDPFARLIPSSLVLDPSLVAKILDLCSSLVACRFPEVADILTI